MGRNFPDPTPDGYREPHWGRVYLGAGLDLRLRVGHNPLAGGSVLELEAPSTAKSKPSGQVDDGSGGSAEQGVVCTDVTKPADVDGTLTLRKTNGPT
jgi:hypothetical protein